MEQATLNFSHQKVNFTENLRDVCKEETVKCMDCISLLRSLEDKSIDLIATDPPYEIDFEKLEWDKKQLDWENHSKGNLTVLLRIRVISYYFKDGVKS